ncbi:hypothetical protein Scep_021583 [Stephania cephalantha]|uniref:Uncharacterized protein n=1 Tax=Stephania cephalantha TaxID=152367 RepID=A0AAP0FE57_9MAGN
MLLRPPVILIEIGMPNPAYEAWYEKDHVCLGWLLSALSKSVASCAIGASSSCDACKTIEEYCGGHCRAQVQI